MAGAAPDGVRALTPYLAVRDARRARPPDHPDSGVQAGKVRDPFGHVWLITHVIPG